MSTRLAGGSAVQSFDYKPRSEQTGAAAKLPASAPAGRAGQRLGETGWRSRLGLRSAWRSLRGAGGDAHSIGMIAEMRARAARRRRVRRPDAEYERVFAELFASLAAGLAADVICYPAETLLHRLMMQGTRTIIDNCDTGSDVIPVSAHYTGVVDAVRAILVEEGPAGFNKGLGALILQYGVQLALVRLAKLALEHMLSLYKPTGPALSPVSPASSSSPSLLRASYSETEPLPERDLEAPQPPATGPALLRPTPRRP